MDNLEIKRILNLYRNKEIRIKMEQIKFLKLASNPYADIFKTFDKFIESHKKIINICLQFEELERIVNKLDEKEKKIAIMYFCDDITVIAISNRLNMNMRTVQRYLTNAKEIIRKELEESYERIK